jgi:electron transport complex protein RnfG
MKPVKSNLFNMIMAMAVVSICSAASIGYVYQKTKEPIEKSKTMKISSAVTEMLGNFDNKPFEERVTLSSNDLELYPAKENGVTTSVAIKSYSNNGFGGKIELIIGLLMDGTITGYKVIQQNETPGLCTKISENKFSKQFVGLNTHSNSFELSKNGGEIDALTGATISSNAVVDAVKKAVTAFNNFAEGTKNDK